MRKQIVVVVAILVEGDKVLITQRASKSNMAKYGKWELPGGKLEFGETMEQAVVRELAEETGYNAEVQHMVPTSMTQVVRFGKVELQLVIFAFRCYISGEKVNAKDSHMVMGEQWVKPENINFSDCLDGIENFLKKDGLLS